MKNEEPEGKKQAYAKPATTDTPKAVRKVKPSSLLRTSYSKSNEGSFFSKD